MKTRCLIKLSVLLCLTMSIGIAQSTTLSWGSINRISFDSNGSFVPQIISSGDTVHILWFGVSGFGQIDSNWGTQYTRSIDGGKTFSHQKRLVHVDSTAAFRYMAKSGNYLYIIYVALVDSPTYWATAMLRSTDAGVSWEKRKILQDYTPYAVAARDSHIYVYSAFTENNKFYNAMLISKDYGVSWDTTRIVIPAGPNFAKLAVTKNALHLIRTVGINMYEEVFYERSTDHGYTWSKTDTLSTDDGQNGQNPRVVSNDSSLFVVWNDQKYGGNFSGTIFLRRSTNEGKSWQPEQIVSELNIAAFSDIGLYNNLLAIVWDIEADSIGAVRCRISDDLGNTFSPIEKISSETTVGRNPTVFVDKNVIHTGWWSDNDLEVYYRRGVVIPTSVQNDVSVPTHIVLFQNYPNPFNPITVIYYSIAQPGFVILKVYDVLGKEVLILVEGYQTAGGHTYTFDASGLSGGVYFYRLMTKEISEVRKMILLK